MTSSRLIRAAAGLVVACVAAVGIASPSFADGDTEDSPRSSGQCASGSFCVWSGTLYTGTFASASSTTSVAVGGYVGSVWNRSSKAAAVYSGSGGAGTSTCYAPGVQVSSVSLAAGSIHLLSSTSC